MIDTTAAETAGWVQAAQAGSPHAFGKLHRRFVGLVHGVLLSRFRPAIAEELTQECFLIAFRKISQLRDPSRFAPWIVTIARRMEAHERWDDHAAVDDIADVHPDPEISAEAGGVLLAIRSLPEAYRETLVLRLVEGMSGLEIAKATGMRPESVRVNLHRGMRRLREALDIAVDSSLALGDPQ